MKDKSKSSERANDRPPNMIECLCMSCAEDITVNKKRCPCKHMSSMYLLAYLEHNTAQKIYYEKTN